MSGNSMNNDFFYVLTQTEKITDVGTYICYIHNAIIRLYLKLE